ncbi:hypothetical protein LCGC14_1510900 [marine sediment metagenome]|uniref:Uncharacterized protein n=1 Tax=marine sediment metagenome TaxID=412755 RepID=A0A0F9J1H8_9ZZZZ
MNYLIDNYWWIVPVTVAIVISVMIIYDLIKQQYYE